MFAKTLRRPAATRSASRTKRSPVLESLEGRQLMSLSAEFGISPTSSTSHVSAAVASSSNGNSVAVWTDYTSGYAAVMGQRLNSHGNTVGPAFVVAEKTGVNEFNPAVAMDSKGDFVVTWTEDHDSGGTNVLAQKFTPTASPVNGVVPVGVGTFAETDPSVAMDAKGNFVVAYTRNTNNDNLDVFAKQYNTNSQLLNVVTVAGTPQSETDPKVAMSPDGRFDVAYQYFYNNNYQIIASRYNASGGLLQQSTIASTAQFNESPSLAMDNNGNAVIAYEKWNGSNWDIEARRLGNNGSLSSEITVQATSANEMSPSVALEENANAFAVAYTTGSGVNVTEVNSSNHVISTLSAGSNRYGPAISINAQNNFLVAYTEYGSSTSSISGRTGLL